MDYEQFCKDLYGYAVWAFRRGHSSKHILANVMHDLGGVINKEQSFLPRTTGYWGKAQAIANSNTVLYPESFNEVV